MTLCAFDCSCSSSGAKQVPLVMSRWNQSVLQDLTYLPIQQYSDQNNPHTYPHARIHACAHVPSNMNHFIVV